jgi:hypothetical protein
MPLDSSIPVQAWKPHGCWLAEHRHNDCLELLYAIIIHSIE